MYDTVQVQYTTVLQGGLHFSQYYNDVMNYTVEFWARFGGMFHGLAKLSAAGIPTIAVLHGFSTAGGAYQPGLCDYIVLVQKQSNMFLNTFVNARNKHSFDPFGLGPVA